MEWYGATCSSQSKTRQTHQSTQSSHKSEEPHQVVVAAWLPFLTLWIAPKRLVAYYLKSRCIIIILLQHILYFWYPYLQGAPKFKYCFWLQFILPNFLCRSEEVKFLSKASTTKYPFYKHGVTALFSPFSKLEKSSEK